MIKINRVRINRIFYNTLWFNLYFTPVNQTSFTRHIGH
jgi:hypothetical protein